MKFFGQNLLVVLLAVGCQPLLTNSSQELSKIEVVSADKMLAHKLERELLFQNLNSKYRIKVLLDAPQSSPYVYGYGAEPKRFHNRINAKLFVYDDKGRELNKSCLVTYSSYQHTNYFLTQDIEERTTEKMLQDLVSQIRVELMRIG